MFWTSRAALVASGHASLVETLDGEVVPDGMPFVIDDDGWYDLRLSAFLRSLPSTGARAASTWTAYGRDVVTWCRFLKEVRGRSAWDACTADFEAFYRARRLGDPPMVSSSTWDRGVTAISRLYRWALRERIVTESPVCTVTKSVRLSDGTIELREVPAGREGRGDDEVIRSVSLSQYRAFRQVGLRGLLPDGRRDARFRGANVARNVAFADLLLTTGMRVGEANATTAWELPSAVASGDGRASFVLSPAITKNETARKVFVSAPVLRAAWDYAQFERPGIVDAGTGRGLYEDGWTVGSASRRGLRTSGRPVPWAQAGPVLRASTLTQADDRREPVALWLTRDGRPMSTSTWQEIFDAANRRCARLDVDVHVTPHMLRHTFAVETLSALVRVHLRRAAEGQSPTERAQAAYAWLTGDPIRRVQLLLGHRSEATTRRYLGSVHQVEELVDAAMREWEDRIAVPVLDEAVA